MRASNRDSIVYSAATLIAGILLVGLWVFLESEKTIPAEDAQIQSESAATPSLSLGSAAEGSTRVDPVETGEPCASPRVSPDVPPVAAAPADECAEMRIEIVRLHRELELARAPEDSPLGSFLRLPSAASMTDQERGRVRIALEAVPVVLTPAEADWIARHEDELCGHGRDYLSALVAFLGPARIVREVRDDPSRMAVLRAAFPGDLLSDAFGGSLGP